MIKTTLKKITEDPTTNAYVLVGKSENKPPIDKAHMCECLGEYIKKPMLIPGVNMKKVYYEINKMNVKKKSFFTTCLFCINGKCNNKYFSVNFKLNTNTIKIDICYPELSKCRTRVTYGFHIDFDFTYKRKKLQITGIKPFIQPPRRKRQSRHSSNTVIKILPKPEFNIMNFPGLPLELYNDKSNKDWNTVGNEYKLRNMITLSKKNMIVTKDNSDINKQIIETERLRLVAIFKNLTKKMEDSKQRITRLEQILNANTLVSPDFNDIEFFNDDYPGCFTIR